MPRYKRKTKGRHLFSDEQRQLLYANPYVKCVDCRDYVYLTDEFKQVFSRRYQAGESPVFILRDLGIDPDIIGERRKNGIIRRYGDWIEREKDGENGS